jgi:hypothetical protein
MSISTAAQPAFDPANFVKGQPIDNPYLPWKPGTTFLYHTYLPGNVLEQIDTVTVTNKTKRIDGVVCTAVSDVVTDPKTGQIIENTTDYYAQDKSGNVWYFGERSAEYDNGKLVTREGSWRAGIKGALPGIIQEANPQVGDSYDEENAPNVAHDHGVVTSLTGSASVPFGTFKHDLLVTHETSTLEPGAAENKYYRAGVGEVFGRDLVTGEEDRLVSVTTDTGTSKLVQAMAGFGGGGPSLNTSPLNAAANETGLQHTLAANAQHG